MKRGATAENVDEYLAALPENARAALAKLRKAIKTVAPEASESISYQIPMYKQDGPLVAFAAFANHYGFYVMSPHVLKEHAGELKQYKQGKGSIQFPVDKPIPTPLVKKLVKARLAENEVRALKKGRR